MRISFGKDYKKHNTKTKNVLTFISGTAVADGAYVWQRRGGIKVLPTIWVDIRAAEVAEDNMQVIGDEHVTEVGVIPYNTFGMKMSDPLGNFNRPSDASLERNFWMLLQVAV